MGLREERRVEMRARIVRAAMELAVERGAAAVSIRAVAARVGCSPMALYAYFASREQLLRAAAGSAFDNLAAALRAALPEGGTPVERLEACLPAYVRHGLAHPQEYRMMFGSAWAAEVASSPAADGRMTGSDAFDVLTAVVAAALDPRARRPETVLAVACELWASAHGVTSLALVMPNAPVAGVAEALARHLVAGLRSAGLVGSATASRPAKSPKGERTSGTGGGRRPGASTGSRRKRAPARRAGGVSSAS